MSEYKWNADAFDAIRIVAANGEFEIVGGDTNQVLVEGEERSRRRFGSEPSIAGRWLMLSPFGGGTEWSLTLPKSKAWVIEVSCASGELQMQDLHARVDVQLGSGEIHLENCRGVFNLRSGSGDVRLENCEQAEVPQAPEHVAQEQQAGAPNVPPAPGIPPIPAIPPIPPIPPIAPFGRRVRQSRRAHGEAPQDWEEYGRDWEEWGENFGEQVSRWAEKFSRDFIGDFKFGSDDEARADGVHVRLGSGDVVMQELDAQLVTTRIGSGDFQIEQGRIAELDVENSRGDVQIEGVLPTAAWDVTTRHGDIEVVLPGDAYARLDAATRHGEIECDAPLVRVGRPGPGARHGGRMVGTVGEGTGEPVDIHLESQHGDIQIEMERRPSRFAAQGAPRAAPNTERSPQRTQPQRSEPQRADEGSAQRTVATREPASPAVPIAGPNDVVPVTVTDLPEPEAALNPPKEGRVQVYDSQFAILQALQAGEITVAEAEMLLRSLKS